MTPVTPVTPVTQEPRDGYLSQSASDSAFTACWSFRKLAGSHHVGYSLSVPPKPLSNLIFLTTLWNPYNFEKQKLRTPSTTSTTKFHALPRRASPSRGPAFIVRGALGVLHAELSVFAGALDVFQPDSKLRPVDQTVSSAGGQLESR